MDLTSLRRVKLGLGVTTTKQDSALGRAIASGAARIAAHLKRILPSGQAALQLQSRTEYFSPKPGQTVFYPRAYPITSIASIEADSSGRWTGDEVDVDPLAYIIGPDLRSIVFARPFLDQPQDGFQPAPGALRATLTAGLATHPTVSVYAWTPTSSAFAVGKFIQGTTSGFIGYLTASSASSISFELLSGRPQTAETLTEYGDLDFSLQGQGLLASTGLTGTLGAATTQSLAELYPDLVEACEWHVELIGQNKRDFLNQIVSREGENRASFSEMQKNFFSIPQVRDMLDRFVDRLIR